MEWKNQLTKTPYLVLFIILISVGVGTASALITITLAGDVHITGDASVDGDLSVGTNDASDDDSILFDDGTKVLRWDDSIDRFEISDDLALPGVLEAGIDTEGVVQFQTPYHRFGFATTSHGLVDANDVVVNGEFEVNGVSFFDGGLTCPGCIDSTDIATDAVGGSELSDVVYIVEMQSLSDIMPGQISTSIVPCEIGDRAIGGGASTGSVDIDLLSSKPFTDTWFTAARNNAAFAQKITHSAVCLDITP